MPGPRGWVRALRGGALRHGAGPLRKGCARRGEDSMARTRARTGDAKGFTATGPARTGSEQEAIGRAGHPQGTAKASMSVRVRPHRSRARGGREGGLASSVDAERTPLVLDGVLECRCRESTCRNSHGHSVGFCGGGEDPLGDARDACGALWERSGRKGVCLCERPTGRWLQCTTFDSCFPGCSTERCFSRYV